MFPSLNSSSSSPALKAAAGKREETKTVAASPAALLSSLLPAKQSNSPAPAPAPSPSRLARHSSMTALGQASDTHSMAHAFAAAAAGVARKQSAAAAANGNTSGGGGGAASPVIGLSREMPLPHGSPRRSKISAIHEFVTSVSEARAAAASPQVDRKHSNTQSPLVPSPSAHAKSQPQSRGQHKANTKPPHNLPPHPQPQPQPQAPSQSAGAFSIQTAAPISASANTATPAASVAVPPTVATGATGAAGAGTKSTPLRAGAVMINPTPIALPEVTFVLPATPAVSDIVDVYCTIPEDATPLPALPAVASSPVSAGDTAAAAAAAVAAPAPSELQRYVQRSIDELFSLNRALLSAVAHVRTKEVRKGLVTINARLSAFIAQFSCPDDAVKQTVRITHAALDAAGAAIQAVLDAQHIIDADVRVLLVTGSAAAGISPPAPPAPPPPAPDGDVKTDDATATAAAAAAPPAPGAVPELESIVYSHPLAASKLIDGEDRDTVIKHLKWLEPHFAVFRVRYARLLTAHPTVRRAVTRCTKLIGASHDSLCAHSVAHLRTLKSKLECDLRARAWGSVIHAMRDLRTHTNAFRDRYWHRRHTTPIVNSTIAEMDQTLTATETKVSPLYREQSRYDDFFQCVTLTTHLDRALTRVCGVEETDAQAWNRQLNESRSREDAALALVQASSGGTIRSRALAPRPTAMAAMFDMHTGTADAAVSQQLAADAANATRALTAGSEIKDDSKDDALVPTADDDSASAAVVVPDGYYYRTEPAPTVRLDSKRWATRAATIPQRLTVHLAVPNPGDSELKNALPNGTAGTSTGPVLATTFGASEVTAVLKLGASTQTRYQYMVTTYGDGVLSAAVEYIEMLMKALRRFHKHHTFLANADAALSMRSAYNNELAERFARLHKYDRSGAFGFGADTSELERFCVRLKSSMDDFERRFADPIKRHSDVAESMRVHRALAQSTLNRLSSLLYVRTEHDHTLSLRLLREGAAKLRATVNDGDRRGAERAWRQLMTLVRACERKWTVLSDKKAIAQAREVMDSFRLTVSLWRREDVKLELASRLRNESRARIHAREQTRRDERRKQRAAVGGLEDLKSLGSALIDRDLNRVHLRQIYVLLDTSMSMTRPISAPAKRLPRSELVHDVIRAIVESHRIPTPALALGLGDELTPELLGATFAAAGKLSSSNGAPKPKRVKPKKNLFVPPLPPPPLDTKSDDKSSARSSTAGDDLFPLTPKTPSASTPTAAASGAANTIPAPAPKVVKSSIELASEAAARAARAALRRKGKERDIGWIRVLCYDKRGVKDTGAFKPATFDAKWKQQIAFQPTPNDHFYVNSHTPLLPVWKKLQHIITREWVAPTTNLSVLASTPTTAAWQNASVLHRLVLHSVIIIFTDTPLTTADQQSWIHALKRRHSGPTAATRAPLQVLVVLVGEDPATQHATYRSWEAVERRFATVPVTLAAPTPTAGASSAAAASAAAGDSKDGKASGVAPTSYGLVKLFVLGVEDRAYSVVRLISPYLVQPKQPEPPVARTTPRGSGGGGAASRADVKAAAAAGDELGAAADGTFDGQSRPSISVAEAMAAVNAAGAAAAAAAVARPSLSIQPRKSTVPAAPGTGSATTTTGPRDAKLMVADYEPPTPTATAATGATATTAAATAVAATPTASPPVAAPVVDYSGIDDAAFAALSAQLFGKSHPAAATGGVSGGGSGSKSPLPPSPLSLPKLAVTATSGIAAYAPQSDQAYLALSHALLGPNAASPSAAGGSGARSGGLSGGMTTPREIAIGAAKPKVSAYVKPKADNKRR